MPADWGKDKSTVNDDWTKDYPKIITLNEQCFPHYYFTTMTQQDTHSRLGFVLCELLLSRHSLYLQCICCNSQLPKILFILSNPEAKCFAFFYLFTNPWCTGHQVGKLDLLCRPSAQQEVSTSSWLSPNAIIMTLPGFHEILHLLARPLTIIQILDYSIVPGRRG